MHIDKFINLVVQGGLYKHTSCMVAVERVHEAKAGFGCQRNSGPGDAWKYLTVFVAPHTVL